MCSMAYTVTSDTVGLAIGPMAETANDVYEALSKARDPIRPPVLVRGVLVEPAGRVPPSLHKRTVGRLSPRCNASNDQVNDFVDVVVD